MKTTCSKCHGTGYLSVFAHIENGICFACGGTGEVDIEESKESASLKSEEICDIYTLLKETAGKYEIAQFFVYFDKDRAPVYFVHTFDKYINDSSNLEEMREVWRSLVAEGWSSAEELAGETWYDSIRNGLLWREHQ